MIFRAIFFIIAFSYSTLGIAQTAEVSKVGDTECATVDDKVTPANGTICEDDIAFGILYEMFPSIFNEIIPVWNLDEFTNAIGEINEQTMTGEYHGDKVFYTLFKLFYNLAVYAIAIYAAIFVASFVVRLIKGESINERRDDKDSPKTVLGGVAIGGTFFIPYKQFFIGQLFIFTLGVCALSMANFVYSVFLAGNQSLFTQTVDPTRASALNPNQIDRHTYIADSFYRYLTRMQICREQTAKYQLMGAGANAQTPDELLNLYSCGYGNRDNVVRGQSDIEDYPGFTTRFLTAEQINTPTRYLYQDISQLLFAIKPVESNLCYVDGNYTVDFYCGGMNLKVVNWGGSDLVELLDDPVTLFSEIDRLSDRLTPVPSPENINAIMSDSWSRIERLLSDALIDAWDKEEELKDQGFVTVDNAVVRKGDALKSVILGSNQESFNEVASMLHLHAMNVITAGQYRMYKKAVTAKRSGQGGRTTSRTPWSKSINNEKNITIHLEQAEIFASMSQQGQCMSYSWDTQEAIPVQKFISGEVDILDAKYNPRCLDMIKNELIEENPSWKDASQEELSQLANIRFNEIEAEFSKEWNDKVGIFASQRRAIESSYSKIIRDSVDGSGSWGKMRSQGYLSAADYAQNMTNSVNNYKSSVMRIINNFEMTTPQYGTAYVSESVLAKFDLTEHFPEFTAGDEVLGSTSLSGGKVDPLVGPMHWISTQEHLVRQPSLSTNNNAMSMSSILDIFSAPPNYFDRLGIDLVGGEKTFEKCEENPLDCPYPLTDPVVELSLMGHDMLDKAISFYSIAFIARSGAEALTAAGAKAGAITNITNNMAVNTASQSGVSSIGFGGTIVALLKEVGGIADLIYKVLGGIMSVFFAMGLILAYLLPFLPKIYLYFGFITWLMVLVMASFAVFLWSIYWVRFKEKRDILKMAGYHYGVELMFKPTFNLIAVIFAWYFFYVVAFTIGASMGWVFSLPVAGEGHILRQYTDTLFIILIIGMVYFVGLKYSYQLMDDLSGEMLEKLGVRNKKIDDQMSTLLKAMLYEKAQGGLSQLHNKLGGKDTKQKDLNRLKQAQEKIKVATQGNGGGS